MLSALRAGGEKVNHHSQQNKHQPIELHRNSSSVEVRLEEMAREPRQERGQAFLFTLFDMGLSLNQDVDLGVEALLRCVLEIRRWHYLCSPLQSLICVIRGIRGWFTLLVLSVSSVLIRGCFSLETRNLKRETVLSCSHDALCSSRSQSLYCSQAAPKSRDPQPTKPETISLAISLCLTSRSPIPTGARTPPSTKSTLGSSRPKARSAPPKRRFRA